MKWVNLYTKALNLMKEIDAENESDITDVACDLLDLIGNKLKVEDYVHFQNRVKVTGSGIDEIESILNHASQKDNTPNNNGENILQFPYRSGNPDMESMNHSFAGQRYG